MPNSKKLLIVEDSTDLQELLQHLFLLEGYTVECSSNGEAALAQLEANGESLPNLILLDLMMPIMNGFEFRKRQKLNPQYANIPTVVMTAHGDTLLGPQYKLDVNEVLRKPVDLDTLLEVVKRNIA